MAQLVKNPSAMQETWVQSLGWKDALEKGMATHSRFWPGEFHELYSPWGPKELDMIERLSLFFFFFNKRMTCTLNKHLVVESQLNFTFVFLYPFTFYSE